MLYTVENGRKIWECDTECERERKRGREWNDEKESEPDCRSIKCTLLTYFEAATTLNKCWEVHATKLLLFGSMFARHSVASYISFALCVCFFSTLFHITLSFSLSRLAACDFVHNQKRFYDILNYNSKKSSKMPNQQGYYSKF